MDDDKGKILHDEVVIKFNFAEEGSVEPEGGYSSAHDALLEAAKSAEDYRDRYNVKLGSENTQLNFSADGKTGCTLEYKEDVAD